MMKKVLFGLSLYVSAMLFIWCISSIFSPSPKQAYSTNIRDTRGEVIFTKQMETAKVKKETAIKHKKISNHQVEELHDLKTVAAEITVTSPFGFTVKITEENEEEQSLLHFYSFTNDLTNYNYVEEIEKRKSKAWYKRKFALRMIKNRIKILKSKKWKLNILV